MKNVQSVKVNEQNVIDDFKERLIFENVLQKVKMRYKLSKELDAVNNNFDFINKTTYNTKYFKSIPIDEMLYSILMNTDAYTKLVNPLMGDINIIEEYVATMQKSQKHMKAYTLLLIKSIAKYTGKVTKEDLFNLYIATIYNFFFKYDYHNINLLEWIINKVMKEIYIKEKLDISDLEKLKLNISKIGSKQIIFNNFFQISSYILLEGIGNGDLKINPKKATLRQTNDVEISTISRIYKNCFDFIDKVDLDIFNKEITKSSIQEYIQIIGVEHYKNYVRMIIDELPIVDEIELDFRFTTFNTSNKYFHVLDVDTFGSCAIEFAKRGMMNEEILKTLKEMKSPLVDIYVSYMIMEEMKNGTI